MSSWLQFSAALISTSSSNNAAAETGKISLQWSLNRAPIQDKILGLSSARPCPSLRSSLHVEALLALPWRRSPNASQAGRGSAELEWPCHGYCHKRLASKTVKEQKKKGWLWTAAAAGTKVFVNFLRSASITAAYSVSQWSACLFSLPLPLFFFTSSHSSRVS